nr:unnamed protein product [Naegleria fowleri]
MIQSIPCEFVLIFWKKLEFCVRHVKKTLRSKENMNTNNGKERERIWRTSNENIAQQHQKVAISTAPLHESSTHHTASEDFMLIYSTKFEDPRDGFFGISNSTETINQVEPQYSHPTTIKPRLGKILVLTRWDGIDLLPQNFLHFFTELSHQYSPERRVKALYMISQSEQSQKKEIIKLHDIINTFKNNASLLNIMERKLITWTGNNDYCSLYVTCCHFMKNLLAGSCLRLGVRGVRERKEQQLYEALEFASVEVQRHVISMKKADENFDGNITMEMMQLSSQQLLKDYDGQYHTLFHLLRPFIFEMHKIATIRWFLKRLLKVKKQTRLNQIVNEYYSRLSWLDL